MLFDMCLYVSPLKQVMVFNVHTTYLITWHMGGAHKMLGVVKGTMVKYLVCSEGRGLRPNPTATSSLLCASLNLSVFICKMGDQRWHPPHSVYLCVCEGGVGNMNDGYRALSTVFSLQKCPANGSYY